MLDTSPLTAVVERFADRLRSAPQSRLQRGAAAEGLALARELSVRAQRLEGLTGGAAPHEMPDDGIFVVGDQLAVAGLDLAEALRTAKAPSEVLDEAVRLVEQAEVRAMR
ncbi:hypothetical protein OHS33_14435 [Streptomyces sp. NBC_00536]|uniref:hypothetical protein n=1 Tax=Streptomyces sp. NBC_00536 TaxID=2975769 RepID=UPI002E80D98C|nr:hypothetical protein [Streptomyces sp. NBC_00536]WUC79424.1 hypothetical protein OHS33_14435 [Streptomyces sp. NBC_00536]